MAKLFGRKGQIPNTIQENSVLANTAQIREEKTTTTESGSTADDHVYPGPWALASITAALYLTMFLVSLVCTLHPPDDPTGTLFPFLKNYVNR